MGAPAPLTQDPSQAPTTPAQRETSPTRPYTSHGPHDPYGQPYSAPLPPESHGAAGTAQQEYSSQTGVTPTDGTHAGPSPSATPHTTAPPREGRAARHRARQRKPGPPRHVAVPMLLLALVCFAVGIWALTQM